jgi:ribonucleoside-triphosphate reductase
MPNNYLPTTYQEFIHLSRYSRWLPEKERRETWDETVARYFDFFTEHLKETVNFTLSKELRTELEQAVLGLRVMPSMRCIMTAGEALKRENIAGYNCSYVAVDRPQAFDEILYILMNGTGVGFSVERQYVSQLPTIADEFFETDTTITVADSKLGWAKALKELIGMLYIGQIPRWDLSKVRPAGAPLKTFGGRASGPEPLESLMNFTVNVFKNAAGRKLSSIEAHDVVCKIAEVVVVGGVRRSALISLSNLSDDRMRAAKSGQWWNDNPQRALANNSAAYSEKPDIGVFMDEWKSLYDSKSGERGIFNRESAVWMASKNGRRNVEDFEFGTNPCSEIILRNREFCNLSEVVVRASDTRESLLEKVRLATILGTFQSTLVNFKYVSKSWRKNCEEERLLGVSLTGIMDCKLTNGKDQSNCIGPHGSLPTVLKDLKSMAVKTNKEFAEKLGINQSVAVTCVKPSGTVSQLTDSASGIHARHNPYYIRTVRGDKKDPLTKMMTDVGFPVEDDAMNPSHTSVFSFPMKVDDSAVFRTDMTAIEQLELWKTYQENWCEHKPSVTISVKENEWLEVGAWVYENFNYMSGVSFLPFSEHTYKQAPYQDCSQKEYEILLNKMPKSVEWEKLAQYEQTDMTIGAQELACAAGFCEIQ